MLPVQPLEWGLPSRPSEEMSLESVPLAMGPVKLELFVQDQIPVSGNSPCVDLVVC